MIHYTCDRCKRAIDPEAEARYVVEIDVRLANVVVPSEEEFEDIDQLSELHDQLQRELNAELGRPPGGDPEDRGCEDCDGYDGPEHYDLCQQCYEVFVSNPLGRESTVGFGFSNN